MIYRKAIPRNRADECWFSRNNFFSQLTGHGWLGCILINRRRCNIAIFGILGVIIFEYPLQMSDFFDRFPGVFSMRLPFRINEIIKSRWFTIYSLLSKNYSVHARINVLFRLFSFFNLKVISDFFYFPSSFL